MGTGDLGCYTLAGRPVWKINLQERYGRFNIQFGMASTPVLHDGRLYAQLIHGDGDPATNEAVVACLDAATGRGLWKSPRVTGAHTENEHSYASPILYDFGGLRLVITHGADYTIAYDLDDGREVWRMGDLTGNPRALLWKTDSDTPDVPSPLIHGGLVYLCRENGNLLCLDARTGETLYHERTHRERHRASPVYADGHVYLTARDGRITVVKAERRFEVVAENELGEEMSSSPAISNGTIYLRTFEALWAIRERA